MSKLIIVESPSKCKKIEGFLGAGYKCVATSGHITKLNSLDDIDAQYHPTFSAIERSKTPAINHSTVTLLAKFLG